MYNSSDAQTEYQIKNRLSFMRFFGLSLYDTVPDEKTIGEYREQVAEA
ncbi:MAG: transposase [Treponema sp.]|nr:transposase [Treponema sp.]